MINNSLVIKTSVTLKKFSYSKSTFKKEEKILFLSDLKTYLRSVLCVILLLFNNTRFKNIWDDIMFSH